MTDHTSANAINAPADVAGSTESSAASTTGSATGVTTGSDTSGTGPSGTGPSETGAAAEYPIKRFRRSHTDRMVAGLCGGAAELLGIDATLIRLLLIAATLLGFGLGIILYLICWVVVPQE